MIQRKCPTREACVFSVETASGFADVVTIADGAGVSGSRGDAYFLLAASRLEHLGSKPGCTLTTP